jgi:hypothetical protein
LKSNIVLMSNINKDFLKNKVISVL